MLDRLPRPRHVGNRNLCILANVDRNILGAHSELFQIRRLLPKTFLQEYLL
jgi:hypothetical protein